MGSRGEALAGVQEAEHPEALGFQVLHFTYLNGPILGTFSLLYLAHFSKNYSVIKANLRVFSA